MLPVEQNVDSSKRTPYTAFKKTKLVPLKVWQAGKFIDSTDYDEVLWIERGEDWYALSSLSSKRVLVVQRDEWLRAEEVV